MSDWLRFYLNGRVKWGYLAEYPPQDDALDGWLNTHGRRGWELVAVRSNGQFVFKRGNG